MIPVSDNVRKLLIQAVESELEQLRIEHKIPAADKGLMTDAEYVATISRYEFVLKDLIDNRLAIFDTRPQCSIGMCEAEGRYEPIIYVFLPNTDAPCAQLAVQPPTRCCTQHADGQLNKYLNTEQWREIQVQVQKQAGQVAHFNDTKIMYKDHQTQAVVPPPNPGIVLVDTVN